MSEWANQDYAVLLSSSSWQKGWTDVKTDFIG